MTRRKKEDRNGSTSVEHLKFSDIEDAELNKYLLSANERRYKTALWELINKDYFEVGNTASAQKKAYGNKSQDNRKSDKDKKRKRGQDGGRLIQNTALSNKAVELDAKKKVKLSVTSDPDINNDATENWIENEFEEFTFNDDEE